MYNSLNEFSYGIKADFYVVASYRKRFDDSTNNFLISRRSMVFSRQHLPNLVN